MNKKLRKYVQLFWKDFKFLFLEMLPKSKIEKSILAASLCLYLPIVIFLVIKTNFLWSLNYFDDVIFDFDSLYSLTTLLTSFKEGWRQIFSHPFIPFVYIPFKIVGYIFFLLGGIKARFYFLLLIFPCLVSFTNVFVFRYLKKIAKISTKRALFLTSFFAFFATNLTLSFTPESYPFSMFFLSFMIMLFSGLILTKKKIPFFQLFILSFLTGGVTSTNFVKCFIPGLFSKLGFLNLMKRFFIILVIFISIYGLLAIKSNKIEPSVLWYQKFTTTDYYGNEYKTSTSNALFSYFWSAPFIWGDFSYIPLWEKSQKNDAPFKLNILPCSGFADYIFGSVILVLCIISVYVNRKNKLIYILLLSFAVDLFISGGLKYGLYNSFIFGGHWVFIIPMLLAWMYPGLKNKRQRTIFDIVMVGMFAALLINNTYRMSQIFDFASKYYPI